MKLLSKHLLFLVVISFPWFVSLGQVAALNVQVREVQGEATRFDPEKGTFVPVVSGFVVDRPTLFVTSAGAGFVFSCVGKISGRVSENSRVVLAPAQDGSYEADLRKGTIAMLLDPERPEGGPGFAIRTAQGVTSATGTFFAVTEYKGQTYGKVKKGTVKRKATPAGQPYFAAYLSKSKSKSKPKPKPPAPVGKQ
ncbi:FecR domain-containing protein [Opitutales bacterium]|jgi:hypothetical protein|nr:FecR domain-containing protein [Opitutales bacterium]